MAVTPRKLVHWALDDVSMSDFGSPFSTASSDSMVSTSSLQYINSQLVAHGFTSSPGLSLDGIANNDLERVVKCLLSMLSQRVEDMSRTEELTTKLRTLSYDHERLLSMHRTTTEKAANAEREMNVHKSRLTAATRSLQTTETAHKHTTAELQRTRTSLQAIRATHQSELKKKEKEVERMVEKWSKISDAQVKLMTIPSGMRCANVDIVEGSEVLGKGKGFLEVALEQAEQARNQLGEENTCLRRLVLTTVNEVQSVLHQTRSLVSDNEDEPTPFTLTTLFPLAPQGVASEKLTAVLAALRESLSLLSRSNPHSPSPSTPKEVPVPDGEPERLQDIIDTLRAEIERIQKQSMEHATETQIMFDQFAEDHRIVTTDVREMSVDLMTAPLKDEEKDRLECIKRDLDLERKKFTEAAVRLGKEKAALEAERNKFLDEKRSWQVELMLAELPPTPAPPARASPPNKPNSPRKSPRKSPAKGAGIAVGKAGTGGGGRKTTRVSRRSLLASPTKVELAYETEVLPPLPAPSFTTATKPAPSLFLPAASFLPTSFVLPPPSPHASLPTHPALLPTSTAVEVPQPQAQPSTSTTSPPRPPTLAVPCTPPAFRPFPMAKPLAPRMVHAYSPAKPSPLSRILMLGNSPGSPNGNVLDDSGLLEVLREEDEDEGGFGGEEEESPVGPEVSEVPAPASEADKDGESPLREKKVEPNVAAPAAAIAKGRVFLPEPKRFTAKEKGKGKAEPPAVASSRVRSAGAMEKENNVKGAGGSKVFSAQHAVGTSSRVSLSLGGGGAGESKKGAKVVGGSGMSMSRARLMAKLPPPGKGGPRRVLVDSAEAPPVGRGWRG